LRRGEILGLTREGLELDGARPSLRVSKRVNRTQRRLLVREGAKTEAGQRRIPLSPLVIDALRRRHVQQLEERLAAGSNWQGPEYANGRMTGFVFLSLVRTVLEPRNVYRVWKRVRERSGLDEHTFHDLRHDFECPSCGERLVGKRRCADCKLCCRAVGLGGHCPECDTPLLIDLLGEEVAGTR
jgi:integrase